MVSRAIVLNTALRWGLLNVVLLIAFWRTSGRIWTESTQNSKVAFVYPMMLLVSVAALASARRRRTELPIHDRQADYIVGGMGLALSLAIMVLLVPRYRDYYQLLHLDGYAGLFFMMSTAVLLFGLRPIGRFFPLWLMIFIFNPFPFRLMSIMLGGSPTADGIVMVVVAAYASAVAVGRSFVRGASAALATLVVGGVLVAVVGTVAPDAEHWVMLSVPSVAAGTLVPLAFYFVRRAGRAKRLLDRPVEPLSAKQPWSGFAAALAAAILIVLVPLPPSTAQPMAVAPQNLLGGQPLVTPPGWLTTDVDYPADVRALYSRSGRLVRQRLVARSGDYRWDPQGRPRIAVVDILSATAHQKLGIYPEGTLYPIASTRRSPSIEVILGHGVVARLYTVVDEKLLLTWTKLVFMWENDAVVERVTIITVDDHRPTATFPTSGFVLGEYLNNLFSLFIRGNAIAINADPVFKDRDLILQLGHDLVDAQFSRSQ